MIRGRIKKDLQKAVENSGVLYGNFLDNVEWFWRSVNEENFASGGVALPVGRLSRNVAGLLGADKHEVWLRSATFAKIRGWRTNEGFVEHPEIDRRYFRAIPLVLAYPEHVIEDVSEEGRYLLVGRLEKQFSVVVEIGVQEKKNWLVTAFMVRERYLRNKEEHCLLHKKTGSPAGTAVPPILAPTSHKATRGGGSRFSTLQDTQAFYTTLSKECQVDFLTCAWAPAVEKIHLEHPANPEHGDYSSNIALTISSENKKPQELAEDIVKHFPQAEYLEKIEVAPPGFINFYLKKEWLQAQVGEILEHGGGYGLNEELRMSASGDSSNLKNEGTKIQIEFISANPTGPLHIGNARGGFCGDVLANVFKKVGYKVQREYYINDKGVQVDKLAESVNAWYDAGCKGLALEKAQVQVPEGGYSGEYVREIAQKIHDLPCRQAGREKRGQKFETFEGLKSFAIAEILENIKKTTARMGIKFDQFFSEQSLYDSGDAQKAIEFLRTKNLLYEKEGAVWFKSSRFGDEKDRVFIKSDGEMTYLVSDVAYHLNKFEQRRFDQVILFWGADHHGYVPRFMAMVEAIGRKGQAQVELIQLLKLARGGKEVKMSKRAGEFVTVDDVLDEIGLDAARFHFLAVPLNTPMTLDLEKAKEQSEKNPVYYVQYAHARLSSILRKSQDFTATLSRDAPSGRLYRPEELTLIRKLIQLPEVVVDISGNHEVHRLPQYAVEIADAFHRFYENCRVLSDDKELTAARLGLVRATQIILAETLGLMGISAPERM